MTQLRFNHYKHVESIAVWVETLERLAKQMSAELTVVIDTHHPNWPVVIDGDRIWRTLAAITDTAAQLHGAIDASRQAAQS